MTIGALPRDLRDAIVSSGYFPEFVQATLTQAIDGEEVIDSVVHHEATFNDHQVQRRVTVLVLTPTRFIVGHTDGGDTPDAGQAFTSIETVSLRHIRSVVLTQVAAEPEKFGRGRGGRIAETWLVVNWGAARRVEIAPAICDDPNCEADHGLTAQDLADDLTVRMSSAADGDRAVAGLVRFAARLQRAAV